MRRRCRRARRMMLRRRNGSAGAAHAGPRAATVAVKASARLRVTTSGLPLSRRCNVSLPPTMVRPEWGHYGCQHARRKELTDGRNVSTGCPMAQRHPGLRDALSPAGTSAHRCAHLGCLIAGDPCPQPHPCPRRPAHADADEPCRRRSGAGSRADGRASGRGNLCAAPQEEDRLPVLGYAALRRGAAPRRLESGLRRPGRARQPRQLRSAGRRGGRRTPARAPSCNRGGRVARGADVPVMAEHRPRARRDPAGRPLPLLADRFRRLGRGAQAAAHGVFLPRHAPPDRAADGWRSAGGRPVEPRRREPQARRPRPLHAAAEDVRARRHQRGRAGAGGGALRQPFR